MGEGERRRGAPGERGEKREAILEAALALFAELGFHGASMPQVAERARVAAGTIYLYFESKEALVNALYRRWKQELASAMMKDFPAEAPMREQLRALWQRRIAFALKHPREMAFLELHHHAPYLDEESRALERELKAPARELFERARAQEIVKPLPAEALIAIALGAMNGLFRASQEGELALTQEIIDQAEGCCWEAIRR
jgi:AcrR family transcriptional regulator